MRLVHISLVLFIFSLALEILISCSNASYDFDTKPHKQVDPQESPATGIQAPRSSGSLLFKTETHKVIKDNKLAILVVLDSSSSMRKINDELSELEPLISSIDDTDWVLGVSSTDTDDECLSALIRKDDPDRAQKYKLAFNLEQASTSSKNEGIYKTWQALSCSNELTGNKPWIEEGASVAVVVMSSKDNSSLTYLDPQTQTYLDADEYLINQFKTIRTPGVDLKMYGLIWIPETPSCSRTEGGSWGTMYAKLVRQTSGLLTSICTSSFDSTLRVISSNISTTLTKNYVLEHVPANLQVFVDDTEIKTGFTYTENRVRIMSLDKDSKNIRFEYFYKP